MFLRMTAVYLDLGSVLPDAYLHSTFFGLHSRDGI